MMPARSSTFARRARRVSSVIVPLAVAISCNENLPSGPATFAATSNIGVAHDTLVVGDSSVVQAVATDANGRTVQSLSFVWKSADSSVVGFAAPAATADGSSGRTRTLVGKRTGHAVVTLSLPDSRFVVADAPRTETVVVGGVRILSTHDTTLNAVNDTAVAIAAGLVRSNGALVTRVSQGIRWIHLGSHTSVVGSTGDTIKYIARSNGADTLIATHDLCLISAKCADTAIVRVSQQLTMTVSQHAFLSWSFADSLAPTVTLADRRGNGLAGTTIRFIPVTAADSAVVKISPVIGVSNPTTGVMAVPRLISTGNGSARVGVFALAPDGITIVAFDSLTDVVRQVARRIAIEPLRALITAIDSIPVRPVARDAHGATIADATLTQSAAGIAFNGVWAGPNPPLSTSTLGTLTPDLTGVALPSSNPLAPQIPVVVDQSLITIRAIDTVKAGATQVIASVPVLDSNAVAAFGSWVRFRASLGVTPDSVQVSAGGTATVTWTPPDLAGAYTLTGVRGLPTPMTTLTDSLGRIVMRRSVVVIATDPDPTKSTVAITAATMAINLTATVTITVKDIFGNTVKTATPAAFTTTVTRGALSGMACTLGICTATYTAPATAGADAISVKILGTEIVFSPLALTITP